MSLMASSLVVLVVALTLSVVTAYPTKDAEAYYYNGLHEFPDSYNVRNLDGIGGGNLLRDLDLLRNRAAFLSRNTRENSHANKKMQMNVPADSQVGLTLGSPKRTGCCDSLSGIGIGGQKRNMDEIDRSSFNSFIKKNFDEIDRSGFGSFVKRNFDEIDRSGFGSFVKRSADGAAAEMPQK